MDSHSHHSPTRTSSSHQIGYDWIPSLLVDHWGNRGCPKQASKVYEHAVVGKMTTRAFSKYLSQERVTTEGMEVIPRTKAL